MCGTSVEEAEGQQGPDGEVDSAVRVAQAKTTACPVLFCYKISGNFLCLGLCLQLVVHRQLQAHSFLGIFCKKNFFIVWLWPLLTI